MTRDFDTEIAETLKHQDWTYEEIAEAHNLDEEKFSEYMKKEFDQKESADRVVGARNGYVKEGTQIFFLKAMEWAKQVRDGDREMKVENT